MIALEVGFTVRGLKSKSRSQLIVTELQGNITPVIHSPEGVVPEDGGSCPRLSFARMTSPSRIARGCVRYQDCDV